MLGPRITLATTLMLALELFLRVWLDDPPSLLGMFVSLRVDRHGLDLFGTLGQVVQNVIWSVSLKVVHGPLYRVARA